MPTLKERPTDRWVSDRTEWLEREDAEIGATLERDSLQSYDRKVLELRRRGIAFELEQLQQGRRAPPDRTSFHTMWRGIWVTEDDAAAVMDRLKESPT